MMFQRIIVPSTSRTVSQVRGHVVFVYPSASLMCFSCVPVTDFVEQLKFQRCVIWPGMQHSYALSTDFQLQVLDVKWTVQMLLQAAVYCLYVGRKYSAVC